MALDLTPEQRQTGTGNFQRVVGKLAGGDTHPPSPNRRDFMKGLIGFGTALPLTAAAYFGYSLSAVRDKPVKAALIGCGDEGGVLVSDHNPEAVQIVAISDIRPSNRKRIFVGEGITTRRRGLNYHYGPEADKSIKYFEDYKALLADDSLGIEMVIVAVPLNLHFEVTMAALEAGKHVLCEKLMAKTITDCKAMIAKAKQKDLLLSVGHQRHYSMLYAHAVEVVNSKVLGDIRHIRALWHRNNVRPELLANGRAKTDTIDGREFPIYRDSWRKDVPAEDENALAGRVAQFGWDSTKQLVRWRLFQKTGGGLMAELGSHQLDACSIFLGKKRPLAVSGIGGKHFYRDEREVEDHVYCTFEFPGENYDKNVKEHFDQVKNIYNYNDIVTVTYSSISTNDFENYGECVMGSKGTLITEREQGAFLFGPGGRTTEMTASVAGSAATLAASSTVPDDKKAGEKKAQDVGAAAMGPSISFGYREEMEHLAYCIRQRKEANSTDRANLKPRCDGTVAMADAIIALTSNLAMRYQKRVEFKDDWFDPEKTAAPETDVRG